MAGNLKLPAFLSPLSSQKFLNPHVLYKEFLAFSLCPVTKKSTVEKKKRTMNSVLEEATSDSVTAQTLHKVCLRVMGPVNLCDLEDAHSKT